MLVVGALDVGDVGDLGNVDGLAQLFLEPSGDATDLARHPSGRAQRVGQVLGAEDEEGHHEDHEHLGDPDVEHRGLFVADRPADGSCPSHPPRETGGNTDIKRLSAGARIYFPVWTEGALFSAGDAHFAQGDCEVCGTAIEMDATLRVRFDLRAGVAAERGIRDLQFERDSYVVAPEIQAPRRFFATTGLSVDRSGVNHGEDVTVAARNALLNMIDHLGAEYGYSRQQAYAICSVAVDLKISEMVDVPNFIVSAFLPLDILT